MIAGANGYLGQAAEFAQVFGDDGDLEFEFEVAGHVQKVSGDDEAVVAIRRLEQPVKLPQVVVKVRCDEQFQSSCLAFTHGNAGWVKPVSWNFSFSNGSGVREIGTTKAFGVGSFCRQTKKTRLGFIADASRKSILQMGVSYGF